MNKPTAESNGKCKAKDSALPMVGEAGSQPLLNGLRGLGLGFLMLVVFLFFVLGNVPFQSTKERCQLAYTFPGNDVMGMPSPGTLIVGGDGALLGTALDPATIYRLRPENGSVRVLHVFAADGSEGYGPGGLITTRGGMLFGTCSTGGSAGGGTIFRGNESGGVLILHNFGLTPDDGWGPIGKLVECSSKGIYGTTSLSGKFRAGTVFKVMPNGSDYKILHHFGAERGDGLYPNAGLAVGADEKVYGVTVKGGDQGQGCLYRLGTEGENYESVHSFGEAKLDGAYPYASLLSVGSLLFGTTSGGGKYDLGVIFSLQTETLEYKVVHHFKGSDGVFPLSELVQGPDGCLYGTTAAGGEFGGTLYKFDPRSGHLQVLHKFSGWYDGSAGACPFAGLVLHQGALYGTTKDGGAQGRGTLFRYPL